MNQQTYRGGIIGLGFIGGADQVSGDALKQRVVDLDGTHLVAMQNHPRVEIVAGSSRDAGRRAVAAGQRAAAPRRPAARLAVLAGRAQGRLRRQRDSSFGRYAEAPANLAQLNKSN